MYGKTYMGVERSTFVIAADGTLAKVMRKVKPETHADDVLAALACDVRRRRRRHGENGAVRPRFYMRMRGLEPPRPERHTDLNRARLPIPPHPRAGILAATAGSGMLHGNHLSGSASYPT